MDVKSVLEATVRASHRRLLALLASASRDISGAEDALAHAYRTAAETWPRDGVPTNPEGWLVRVAKNFMVDVHRSHFFARAEQLDVDGPQGERLVLPDDERSPDRRLELMFAAAHPALDESIRAPLIMQTIIGLEVKEIAPLFCTPVATMAQRLVRAKTKIRDAGIPFAIPEPGEWPERLEAVLEAVYGVYCAGFEDAFDTFEEHRLADRGLEAMYLADVLTTLLPDEPEALGLASMIAFSASRAEARTPGGRFVPLDEQDTSQWNDALIRRGAMWLERAAGFGRIGRFQLEAAVHAVHADRRRTGVTDWRAIAQLYEGLLQLAPTLGVVVARAFVISKVATAEAGLKALALIDATNLEQFAPALACRAHLRERVGDVAGARVDLSAAISLLAPGAARTFLETQRDRLQR